MTVKPMLMQTDDNGDSWLVQMGRLLDITKPVKVYRNLHKDCWSIKQGNKVRCHSMYISLSNCTMVVRQKGRQKTIEQNRKNFHAYIQGIPVVPTNLPYDENKPWVPISYDPYKADHFYTVDSNYNPVDLAEYVDMMMDDGASVLTWEPKSLTNT